MKPTKVKQREKVLRCKIDAHIPTEDGLACECGYFIKNRKGKDYIKHIRDTVSNFHNYKTDLIQIVTEDVPFEYQSRLLKALDVNTKHNWDNIRLLPTKVTKKKYGRN